MKSFVSGLKPELLLEDFKTCNSHFPAGTKGSGERPVGIQWEGAHGSPRAAHWSLVLWYIINIKAYITASFRLSCRRIVSDL